MDEDREETLVNGRWAELAADPEASRLMRVVADLAPGLDPVDVANELAYLSGVAGRIADDLLDGS